MNFGMLSFPQSRQPSRGFAPRLSRFVSRALSLGLVVGVLAVQAGCAVHEVTSTINATNVGTRTALAFDRFGICWPGDFDQSVLVNPIGPPGTGEFTAGYSNHVHPGASCNTEISFGFEGAMDFDLSSLRNTVVTRATLHLDRRNTNLPVNVTRTVPAGVIHDDSCMLNVEIATESWTPGMADGSIASRPASPTETPQFEQQNPISGGGTGVQWAVQQWVLGRLPNFGFVLRPQPGAVAKNENTCTGFWSNPRLEVTVLRPDTP